MSQHLLQSVHTSPYTEVKENLDNIYSLQNSLSFDKKLRGREHFSSFVHF